MFFFIAHWRTLVIRIFFFPLISEGVSPIGKGGREGSRRPSSRERERRSERRGRDRGAKKTKRRSAPHESLIESIHGDSGEKKKIARSEIRMAGGGARKCAGSLRGGSRKRTLKSLILEEEETREREKDERQTGRKRERGKIRTPPNLCAESYTGLSCESPEPVPRSVTRFRITRSLRRYVGKYGGMPLCNSALYHTIEYHCMIYY